MGASRWMAIREHRTESAGIWFPGEFVTGSEYERLGEPDAFRPAEFPEQVAALREEYGLDDDPQAVEGEPDLEGLSVPELKELAAERDITGRSDMKRQELLAALRQ